MVQHCIGCSQELMVAEKCNFLITGALNVCDHVTEDTVTDCFEGIHKACLPRPKDRSNEEHRRLWENMLM